MNDRSGSRQHQILELMLKNKAGLSIDETADSLGISRNAVQQHFSILERDGYITTGGQKKTAGRPVRTFVLTESGVNHFPKQYAWFSELIVSDLIEEMGSESFKNYLHKLGDKLTSRLSVRFAGKSPEQRIEELIRVMDELGFQTSPVQTEKEECSISACNCIYHDLAQKHEEICELDKALVSRLLDQEVELVECMAKGGHICRFKTKQK